LRQRRDAGIFGGKGGVKKEFGPETGKVKAVDKIVDLMASA